MLIIGLVGMFQASALANTKILKRLAQEENLRMEIDAVRALSRPIVAEAMLQFDGPHRLPLDGAPYELTFDRDFFVIFVVEYTLSANQPKVIKMGFQNAFNIQRQSHKSSTGKSEKSKS